MPKLSAIVVTKNEAHNIAACLESLAFVDEIVVFDSNSQDATVTICQQYGAKVTVTPTWPGDGKQKNLALAQTTGDWILCLDADERVTPALAQEIQQAIQHSAYQAYSLAYRSTYCGKAIKYGAWRNERHVRLFEKAKARFSEAPVHCKLQVDGKIGRLQALVIHHPFRDLASLLNKLNDYSTQKAALQFQQGKRASLATVLSRSLWNFVRGYVLKLGFLDGKEGLFLAISNAQGCYYSYLKLYYLGKAQSKNQGNTQEKAHALT